MTELTITATTRQECTIVIEPGAVADVAAHLPVRPGRSVVAVLTQPPAGRIAAEVAESLTAAELAVVVRELPDREAAKRLGVVEDTVSWLSGRSVGRADTIVAVGGGALTDAAGFIAAVYLRGIEVVNVPTTLLGAVDAAIGGKTAVNVDGKNLVGAFRQPAIVVIDPELLTALPADLRREGAAEALKAGFIGDPRIVELYETHGVEAPLEDVVARAVAVKAAIVQSDPHERDRRALLNYGHTIGHAVETASGISHGHAVAIGMIAAGRASEIVLGFADAGRQRAVLARVGLPTVSPPVSSDEVSRLIALDKKRDTSGTRMALLAEIGRAEVKTVDDATVTAALAAVGIA